jgi:beta-glucanase (GH16 family)
MGCSGSTDRASDGDAGSGGGASLGTDASGGPGIGGESVGAPGQDRRANPPGQHGAGWKLVWDDEFNEPSCPDTAKWGFERGLIRNKELQWYQPDNASCQHGKLVIEARREDKRNPDYTPGSTRWTRSRTSTHYTSASLISKPSFTYGRFEMRARIDPRWGSWPALWTLGRRACPPPGRSSRSRPCMGWPESGEIDVMESYKGTLLANVCMPRRALGAEWCYWSSTRQSVASLGGRAWAREFHVWAMEWNARSINLFLDGKLVHRFTVADAVPPGKRNPYVDRRQEILLSQAIGGRNGGDPSGTKFPVRLAVDYVRVYQRQTPAGRDRDRPGEREGNGALEAVESAGR